MQIDFICEQYRTLTEDFVFPTARHDRIQVVLGPLVLSQLRRIVQDALNSMNYLNYNAVFDSNNYSNYWDIKYKVRSSDSKVCFVVLRKNNISIIHYYLFVPEASIHSCLLHRSLESENR